MSTDIQVQLKSLVEQLERLGVEHGIADNAAVVVLPGKKKLKTIVGLIPAPDSLRVCLLYTSDAADDAPRV